MRKLFIFIAYIFIGALSTSCSEPSIWAPLTSSHEPSISEYWKRNGVYINQDNQTLMVATNGKLFFIGSETSEEPLSVTALDANTGTKIWQYGDTNSNVLVASSTTLFVGEVGKVVAINPDTGELKWSTRLPARSVTKVLLRDKILYVDTVNNYFLLDAETGSILQSIRYSIDGVPNDNIPNWSDHNMDLEFFGKIMYFQKQFGLPDYDGEVIAIDELTNNQIWSSRVLAASRIAASPLGVFVLDLDGNLLKFDPVNGTMSYPIKFEPSLTMRHQSENGGNRDYGFHIAVDTDNQLLFVYLGDSAQLFAFQLPVDTYQ